jgi:hypothetical protein
MMDANEMAREIAADLAPEFGAALKVKTEQAIKGILPPAGAATRGLHDVADLAVIAHFILAITPIATMIWRSKAADSADSKSMTAELEGIERPAGLPLGVAKKVIDKVIEKLSEHS